MSGTAPSRGQALPLSVEQQLNQACNRFKKAWQAGQRPGIADYLTEAPEAARALLVRELIALDMEYRRRAGEQPRPDDYQAWLPSLQPTQWTEPPGTLGPASSRPGSRPVATPPEIPGYYILGELGRGGMAVVYQGWQDSVHRLVALKMVLAGAHAGPQELTRFRTEAEAVARLQHPHIVQIYEVGQEERHPYMVLEYADGGTLAQKLAGTPLPVPQAAALVETLARAVAYAHQRGIIHRDLTPSNVLLERGEPPLGMPLGAPDAAGQVHHYVPKLSDFGLAKLFIGGGPTLTHSGTALGTPSYMAPEQAAGRIRDIGPATDVYALGAILYETLTGRPPFKAETALETLTQVRSQEPVSPSRLQPKLPHDVTTICLKCLQKEPDKRFASAQALADDLHRFLAGEPIRARPVGPTERLWRWCRRNPVVAGLLASVAALLLFVAIGSSLMSVQLRAALRQSEMNRERAEGAEREAKEKLWQSYRDQARAGRMSGRLGQRLASLQAVGEAAHLAHELHLPEDNVLELRNEAVACLALTDLRVAKEWEGLPPGTTAVVFDGKFEHYAWKDREQGIVSIRRVADDAEIYRLAGMAGNGGPNFSPDGRFVTVAHADIGWLKLWRLAGPAPTLLKEEQGTSADPQFSPDSRQIAFGRADGSLDIYDLASGQRVRNLQVGAAPLHLDFHPTQQRMAIAFRDGIRVYDLDNGIKSAEFPLPRDNWPRVHWHPDGKTLAAVGGDQIIYLWDVATGKQLAKLEGFKNAGIDFTFNHAGDLLASTGWEGMLRLWDPHSGKQLFSTPATTTWLRFSPDDRFLVGQISGNKLRIWEVVGREYRTLVIDPVLDRGQYGHSAFRADGRLLAVGSDDGFGLWDVGSGKGLRFIPLSTEAAVLFEPSGALLVTGPTGLWRWPIQAEAASPGLLRLGPPRKLPLPGGSYPARSTDGKVIVTARGPAAFVLHTDRPERAVTLWPHEDIRHLAVSPNGRWVATASHGGSLQVKVWDAGAGKLATELVAGEGQKVAFSPNGQWLATCGDGVRVWEVESWRAGPRFEAVSRSPLAFSPDSQMLAFETGSGVVRLVDPTGGREYARLEDPNQGRAGWLEFSPDGTQLVITGNDQPMHLWDLRAIRQQLAELGLDWELPSYEPGRERKPAPPFQVRVDLGNAFELLPAATSIGLQSFLLALNPFNFEAYLQRGRAHALRGESRQAIADYSMALALMPPGHPGRGEALLRRSGQYRNQNDRPRAVADLLQFAQRDLDAPLELHLAAAQRCNSLAWQYVMGPEKERDPKRALPLAQKAVQLTPGIGIWWNTLGVVYYRLGQYPESIAKLEQSLRETRGEAAAFDLFVLAMCHARRGDAARAEDCYRQAVHWVENHQGKFEPGWQEELTAFRAEADAVLRKDTRP